MHSKKARSGCRPPLPFDLVSWLAGAGGVDRIPVSPFLTILLPLQMIMISQKSGAFFCTNSLFPNPFFNLLHKQAIMHVVNGVYDLEEGRKEISFPLV